MRAKNKKTETPSGIRAHVPLKPAAPNDMLEADWVPLAGVDQSLPVIYVDGPADVQIHGPIVRITYFEFHGEGAARIRRPCLEMIRPLVSCQRGTVTAMVARKLAQQVGDKPH